MIDSSSSTDEQIKDWVETNVDTDNADDLLEGLDGKGSDDFTVADQEDGGMLVTYNEDAEDGILLPTASDVERFRKRVESKRLSETDEGYLHAITSDHS